jgi:hypothetical protein
MPAAVDSHVTRRSDVSRLEPRTKCLRLPSHESAHYLFAQGVLAAIPSNRRWGRTDSSEILGADELEFDKEPAALREIAVG